MLGETLGVNEGVGELLEVELGLLLGVLDEVGVIEGVVDAVLVLEEDGVGVLLGVTPIIELSGNKATSPLHIAHPRGRSWIKGVLYAHGKTGDPTESDKPAIPSPTVSVSTCTNASKPCST